MTQLTKTGDAVEIRRSGFPVDIDTGPGDIYHPARNAYKAPEDKTEAELARDYLDMRNAYAPDLEPLSCKPWPLPAIFGPDEGPIYYRPAPTWLDRLRAFWDGVRWG